MKKIVSSVVLIVVALACTFAFAACSSADGDVAKLAMEKRYIRADNVNDDAKEQLSYLFHSNGTGEFTYHYDYDYEGIYTEEHTHRHYIIHFKYTYVDGDKSAVVCFYDSIERLEGDDGGYTSTTWSNLVTVSKNVLATVGSSYIFWINEDYLKSIPHFGEEID